MSKLSSTKLSLSPIQILQDSNFRMFWLGQSISLLGDSFYMIALPLLALQLSGGSGLALGTALMFASIPRALLMLFGGAIVDRLSPRSVMITTNWLNALTIVALAFLLWSGQAALWHLYIASFLLGTADAFYFPAAGSIMPFIVEEQNLQVGNSVFQLSQRLLFLVGPALAGLIIATVGIPTALIIDVVTFVLANIFLSAMNLHDAHQSSVSQKSDELSQKTGIFASIFEGLQYVKRDRALLGLMLLIAAIDFGTSGSIRVGLPVLLDVKFGVGAAILGLMISAFGAGAVIGTFLTSRIEVNQIGYLLIGLMLIFGTTFLLTGLIVSLWFMGMMLVLGGVAAGIFNIVSVSWLQKRTDKNILGRVMSLIMLSSVGVMPISQLLSGFMVEIDASLPFIVSGCIMLIVAMIFASSTSLRNLTTGS
ncbi:MAG: MFS transporter [Chloroflexota bacterium]